MKIEPIKIVKQDNRGIIYRAGSVNCILRKKGTISANHTHEEAENLYLVKGKGELTIGKKTKEIKAPAKVFIPAGEYHKLIAFTDIVLIRT